MFNKAMTKKANKSTSLYYFNILIWAIQIKLVCHLAQSRQTAVVKRFGNSGCNQLCARQYFKIRFVICTYTKYSHVQMTHSMFPCSHVNLYDNM